jgi:hypothetical protein
MPAEGDTSVADLTNALSAHGLSLVPVSGEYRKKGGVEFNLLQERQCKLVINLRLTDLDGDPMSHFVAFDGECIHDRPYLSKVNNTYDRTNPEKSKLAFAKLFKPTEFQSWQVTSVYRLLVSESKETKLWPAGTKFVVSVQDKGHELYSQEFEDEEEADKYFVKQAEKGWYDVLLYAESEDGDIEHIREVYGDTGIHEWQ